MRINRLPMVTNFVKCRRRVSELSVLSTVLLLLRYSDKRMMDEGNLES